MKTVNELISLKNRSAIVTGGAGHIGMAICETLLELGATVSVLDRDETACKKRCNELNSKNYTARAIPISANLSDENQIRESVHHSVTQMGGLDILVHSAAFVGTSNYPGWAVPFERQTLDAWEAAMKVNLTAVFSLVQASKPALENSKYPSIILIGSIYGLVGPDNRLYDGTSMVTPAAYAASKGGLVQMARYLGTTLAKFNIRVNIITAGGVKRGQPDSFQKKYVEKTPLSRMATEEDFKGAIAYLSSDLSSYVTGTNLIVDGGWTAL
jgi:NAD(P)-dependent dehydrogenase (short-subunit alcohol dehydrogenase family)